MLERKVGHEAMFAGLRRLTAEHMGRFASWEHLQRAFEAEAGVELDAFFEQWVRSEGAPVARAGGCRPPSGERPRRRDHLAGADRTSNSTFPYACTTASGSRT